MECYVERNKDEENEIVQEQFYYFFPKWLGEKLKKKQIDTLPDEDKNFMLNTILIMSISKSELLEGLKGDENTRIVQILERIKGGEQSLINTLVDEYNRNVASYRNILENKLEQNKYRRLPPKKRQQIMNLHSSGKDKQASIITDEYYIAHPDTIVASLMSELEMFKNMSDMYDVSAYSSEALKCNSDLIPMIAYSIYSPQFLLMSHSLDSDELESMPCKWYFQKTLSIAEFKDFTRMVKKEKEWDKHFSNAVYSINKSLELPILPIRQRRNLIEQIIDNIKRDYYGCAIIVLFSVIEGLLWEMAIILSRSKKVLDHNKVFDCDKGDYFESTRIRDILQRTYMKNYLSDDFLAYFCEELYEERNPILHGRIICDNCKHKNETVINKIFALDYVLTSFVDMYQQLTFETFDKTMTEEQITRLLENYYKIQSQ